MCMNLKKNMVLICCFACSMGWLSTRLSLAIGVDTIYIHPEILDKCLMETETKPDYTLNPYYLRLDLDGDGGMDYVTFIASNSGAFQLYPHLEECKKLEPVIGRSLLVCFSDGRAVIYQGVADRISDAPGSIQQRESNSGEQSHPATKNGGPDAKQSGRASGDERPLFDKSVTNLPAWVAEDRVLTEEESSERNTVSILFSWFPRTKSALLEAIDHYGVPMDSGEVLGESIGEVFRECETLGFWDGKQFRWLMLSVADPPIREIGK